jgi:hypothetical protein
MRVLHDLERWGSARRVGTISEIVGSGSAP